MGTFRAILGNGSPSFPHNPFVVRAGVEDRAGPGTAPLQRRTRAPAPRPQATYLGKASNQ